MKNLRWVKSIDLLEKDSVLMYNNSIASLIAKEIEELEVEEITYNFEVSEYHTYYVGENSVLVHNKCAEAYLNEALERQGLDKVPDGGFKEVWMEGDYKITVRAHAGNLQYTDAKMIYRVSRQKIGFGTEYLGSNNKWYHNQY